MKFTVVMTLIIALSMAVYADNYTYKDDVMVTSSDGTKISGNLFVPKSDDPQVKFPAIIFPNSWAMDEYEYIVQAKKFAEKGYIVLSYSSRGWGKSQGLVKVAGPEDMQDLSACIDWLLQNTPIDEKNIGISGISYGAGISLLGVAHDQRLKTAAAMSVWGDLTTSLYGNESPHEIWGLILLGSGYLTGRMDPVILEHYNNLVNHTNVEKTKVWAAQRSPLTYIDKINQRQVPIYISNNLQDEMFQPNSVMEFFSRLSVPKRLDLNKGIHASAELGGLIGISNYVWDNTHDWFDYWLKGIDTGIMQRATVSMAIKNSEERHDFPGWPSKDVQTKSYSFSKRGIIKNGGLVEILGSESDTISSGILSGLSTGIPVISAIFEAHTPIDIKTWLPGTNKFISVVYQSEAIEESLSIRGTPRVEVTIEASQPKIQMVAHLYDVDPLGVATLITHAPMSFYDLVPGEVKTVSWDLVTTSYNIKKGHKVAVGIDTYDANYTQPSLDPFQIKFHYENGKCLLKVPYANE